jgi:membrane-associated protease RseP (regulator of RpoE activity)
MANFASLKRQVVVPSRARFWLLSCTTVLVAFVAGLMTSVEISTPRAQSASDDEGLVEVAEPETNCFVPSAERCRLPSMHSTVLASVVREWAAPDSNALMGYARLVPAVEQGEMVGFKIYALRPDSPLALLGFQNGDTIYSVGGIELSSVDQVLDLYEQLTQNQPSEVRVELARDRCALTIFLTLV